jgi:hypothetical protein
MTCQDCELCLVEGEMPATVEEHLYECAKCRALHQHLRANALVLGSLRDEELPRIAVKIPGRRHVYPWAAAAVAALFVAALFVPRTPPAQPPRPRKVEPMKIKMLTPDPNVVIYWLIDNQEEDFR